MGRDRQNLQAPIHELFASRWSSRAFSPTPVSAVQLASCLEAARWAPSCYNDQPWRFLVTDLHADPDAWQSMLDCLSPGNQRWARYAPILVLVSAANCFTHDGSPNRWGSYDAGQAALAFCLQATALGLVTHQMGGFDRDKVKDRFAVPADFTPMSVIALGNPGDPTGLEEELQQREAAPRQRKPLQEIVWAGRWGTPYEPSANCGWEARYRETSVQSLPWYQPELDADIEKVLIRIGLTKGKVLDLGTGPGTQAIALGKCGFDVTATDVSLTALKQAQELAAREGVKLHFVQDDILATSLQETFDLIIDRGIFHIFSPDTHPRYLASVSRLLRPGGMLLLKCFSHLESRPEGPPGRYSQEEIERIFGREFDILEIHQSSFRQEGDDNPPKALFCVFQKKEKIS